MFIFILYEVYSIKYTNCGFLIFKDLCEFFFCKYILSIYTILFHSIKIKEMIKQ